MLVNSGVRRCFTMPGQAEIGAEQVGGSPELFVELAEESLGGRTGHQDVSRPQANWQIRDDEGNHRGIGHAGDLEVKSLPQGSRRLSTMPGQAMGRGAGLGRSGVRSSLGAISKTLPAPSLLRRGRRFRVVRECPPSARRGCSRGEGGVGAARCWPSVPGAPLRCIS